MELTRKKSHNAMKVFLDQIHKAMKEQSVTVAVLADRSGVTRAYIYRVLNGTQVPTMTVADDIAKSLGLRITTMPAA